MNHIRIALILTVVALSSALSAQKDIITENGIRYYVHTVEKGQTLYAISKLYSVDVEDITKANPGADQTISIGQVLKIPAGPEEKKAPSVNPVRLEKGMLVHRVMKGETLFGIARQYDVDVNEILEKNPTANSGLKPDMELFIPVKSGEIAKEPEPKPTGADTLHTHLVQPGETLFGISRQYSMTVDSILKVNPGISESLQPGMRIKIPKAGELYTLQTKPVEYKPEVTAAKKSSDRMSIALPLPFFLSEAEKSNAGKNRMLRDISVNLLRGAELAAKQLESEGLRADFRVIDFGDGLSSPDPRDKEFLASADLVVGPLQREAIGKIAPMLKNPNAHLVCPTPQSNKVLLERSNMSKTEASDLSQMKAVAKDIVANHTAANVVLIVSGFADDNPRIEAFRNQYRKSADDSPALVTKTPREVIVAGRSLAGLEEKLVVGKTNVIFLPTTDDLLLQGFMTKLTIIGKKYDIVVYGLEKWREMEIVEHDFRHKFNLHVPVNQYIDYSREEVIHFVTEYRNAYSTEPDSYAFIGHDIMLYYGRGLAEFGTLLPLNFHRINQSGLLSIGFDLFKTGPESGYENNGCFILQYKNGRFLPSDRE